MTEPADTGADRLPSRKAKAQTALRDFRLEGKLGAGQRVSRATPVRSALARLAEEGLLEAIPTSGYAVRSFSEAEVFAAVEIRGRRMLECGARVSADPATVARVT